MVTIILWLAMPFGVDEYHQGVGISTGETRQVAISSATNRWNFQGCDLQLKVF